ncbi:hypothetical protein BDV40DRAFT_300070 [Aspergillus tamarii]|uniref:Uncharacterized protein n=1 Tax=Aspergillus tamarii TaxID=41984 RepID=A0A5N6UY71_ASPTM|nr:hypothetical protein BDV40DRAFT_300070 [Aspergillus tamarii]
MRRPLGGDPNGLLNGSLENGHDQDRRTIGDADLVSMIGRLAPEPMKSGTDIPITICGMGMQLPGGIQDNELKPYLLPKDFLDLHNKDVYSYVPYNLIGVLDFAIMNLVSYEHGLKDPSVRAKTGFITSAIIAGANLILSLRMAVAMSVQAALSPEGSSKFFDAGADGYA